MKRRGNKLASRALQQSTAPIAIAALCGLGFCSISRAAILVWNNPSISTSTLAQWDGTATNWNNTTTSTNNVAYTDGSAVQFSDALNNTKTVALQVGNVTAGGGVSPSSVEFTSSGGTTSYNIVSNNANTAGITGSTGLLIDSGFGGTVFLNNTNTYTGGATVNGGFLRAGAGSLPATTITTLGGGTFLIPTGTTANAYTANENFSMTAGTTSGLQPAAGNNPSFAGIFTSTSGATAANTVLNLIMAGQTITAINFANASTSTPSSSYTGTVAFGSGTGTVRLTTGSPNALFDLGSSTATLAIQTNTSTNVYLGGLQSTGTGTVLTGPAGGTGSINDTYNIGGLGLNTTFAGTIGVGSKGRALLNIVGGSLTMTNGSETYSTSGTNTGAATSVSGGALFVDNASGSGTGPSGVFVNGGTLGGNGFTNGAVSTAATTGAVTVNQLAAASFLLGGHIAPGTIGLMVGSVPGTLTLSDGLSLNDYSNLDFTLNGASNLTGNDLISTAALVAPASGLAQVNFSFTNAAALVPGTSYRLITYAGALTNDPTLWTATGVPAGYSAVFSDTAASNGEVDVTFNAVPEPASIGLIGLASGFLVQRRRRSI